MAKSTVKATDNGVKKKVRRKRMSLKELDLTLSTLLRDTNKLLNSNPNLETLTKTSFAICQMSAQLIKVSEVRSLETRLTRLEKTLIAESVEDGEHS